MQKGSQPCRIKWLRIAFTVAVVIAAHALGGSSAQAASIGPSRLGPARIAVARDALVAHAARGAPATRGITLAGFTSQNYPTFFKVAADGKRLTVGAIALDLNCTSGAEFVLHDVVGRVPISPRGRFHAKFSLPPTAGPNGETYSGSDSLVARLNRRRPEVAGVWRLALSYSFTNGMSDRCDSGPVRFVATG